jgi:hypothetical protein
MPDNQDSVLPTTDQIAQVTLIVREHRALLDSERAVEMSLYVVRAFVYLRELLATNKELAQKLSELMNLPCVRRTIHLPI